MYVNASGDLVAVFEGGNIVTLPGLGSGTPVDTGLDGGFSAFDHIDIVDGGDAGAVGATDINGGGAYESL